MGSLTVAGQRQTSVPPAQARTWMFDLQPEDHDHPRFKELFKPKPGDTRTITSRTATQVSTEDTWGGQKMRFKDTLVGDDTIRIEGEGPGYKSEGTLKFKPAGKGSQVDLHITSQTSGMFALFMLFMGGKFRKQLEQDFQIHCDLMEEDWKKKPW